jgi:hypothetical protein
MSESVISQSRVFAASDPAKPRSSAEVAPTDAAPGPAPAGYRWVAKRWRLLPDGTRDYAAYHGKREFFFLLPVSSKLRTPKR